MQNNFKVCKMVFMIFLFQHFKNKTQYFACFLPFSILYMVVSVYGCFAPRNQFDCVVNSVSLLSFHMFVHFEMQSEREKHVGTSQVGKVASEQTTRSDCSERF